ncbi:NAD(P)-dependent dehydrogenase (short-subunit alcohol dehydrogenase family) [Sphingobium fontiphilum]|uniref:NAD(P)-dependent dehydrogenase (Short-subunit alcohol dehydrogenase family) n=1 Tax=Sphingobium fontiphilum TaxID=944425 RepID=A0A7W6DPM8_9SPHN|nr:SDR family oxidoreductase [Sphingobium fontiphilum]MBB3982799.1 NAD(P)-dependent dehydrogenase (short-subunit alcohol dehydrogenase family) [Sphingobium fontiphilum]
MTAPLQDRVAIITGAGQGIGADVATVLAERGATVILNDILADRVEDTAAAMRARGLRAEASVFDLTDEDDIARAVGAIAARHGRIDIVHNNAAFQTTEQRARDLDVMNLPADAWDKAFAVNARGPMLLCKHVLPTMIAGGGGSIIHSASGFGLLGEMTLTAYGASKAALINLGRFIATQYGKQGVRSNVIAIGFVLSETAVETTPQAVKDVLLAHHLNPELGSPRDIAHVVAFLASDDSRFINGALIPVDGGFTAHQPSMVDFQRLFAAAGSNQL